MQAPCLIRLFGGLRVEHAGRVIERFQTQKTGALLAYLALSPQRMHPREALAEMLWPDGDPLAIRNRLNQAISSLRRQLHLPTNDHGPILIADHHSVGVDPGLVETDVSLFEQTLLRARALPSRERLALLTRADELYRGELMEGFYEEWLLSDRLRLADARAGALKELIELRATLGDVQGAIQGAQRRISEDALDLEGHQDLMRLYLTVGRPESAVAHFGEFRDVILRAGLAIPLEMQDLAQRARQQAGQAQMSPAPVEITTERPSFARLSANSLPLFGREDELSATLSALESSPIVTIIGLGGCGKTRLAQEVVVQRQVQGHEVCFLSLASFADPFDLNAELERAYGQPLASNLGNLDVVLDNAEHLQTLPDQLCSLRTNQPHLRFLVTSRRPLGLREESLISLAPLPVPVVKPNTTLSDLAANPALALYVARAQQVRPDFALTSRTAASLVEVVEKLEGLPLALELAAGWVRAMTPAQMVDQIDSRVDFLESRRRDIGERHRSLRVAIDGSYGLLDEASKDALLRLSIFRGSFDANGAAALCPNGEILDILDALLGHSLLSANYEDEEITRYSMLVLVRSYAENFVSPDLSAECRGLHAGYVIDCILSGRRLPDHVDIHAALEWLYQSGDRQTALQGVVALAHYWEGTGRMQEGKGWLDRLERDLTPEARVARGRLRWVLGDYVGGAQEVADVISEEGEVATSHHILARHLVAVEAHRQGDYEGADQHLRTVLALSESIQDIENISRAHLALGNSLVERRRYDEAHQAYQEALRHAREVENHNREAAALCNLGNLARIQGRREAARQWLGEALAHADAKAFRWQVSMILICAARLATEEKRPVEALELLREADRLAGDVNLVRWRVFLAASFALVEQARFVEAAQALGIAESHLETAGLNANGVEFDPLAAYLTRIETELGTDGMKGLREVGRSLSTTKALTLLQEPATIH